MVQCGIRTSQKLLLYPIAVVPQIFSRDTWVKCISVLWPAIVPPLHIFVLYYYWRQFARNVDRRYCSCSCWDTVFKGTYETGIASYKHFYFNATFNSTKIWILTVICVISFYECVKRLICLAFERRLRFSMVILFVTSIFSHYYSWWAYVNYWNDDFYKQWNHQLFFSITEVISTGYVLYLTDSRNPIEPFYVMPIIGIALIHIMAAAIDQFVANVFKGEGYVHQVIRDLCFMIPDILHVTLPLIELRYSQKQALRALNLTESSLKKELFALCCLVALGLFVISLL
ncbi:unnamed protein product [Bemisia tabaci]|uniref:Uncharacterized protein n=1 Tax=Bemisia tabaci TaxID=7038 RepID=A0A9P0AN53_BEMTA|nr:PREDICTED: uncharacterized protein LOC109033826 [Bemisia tabaci]CAH0394916.1 unnamed protein product [Bemisia tabaci]